MFRLSAAQMDGPIHRATESGPPFNNRYTHEVLLAFYEESLLPVQVDLFLPPVCQQLFRL